MIIKHYFVSRVEFAKPDQMPKSAFGVDLDTYDFYIGFYVGFRFALPDLQFIMTIRQLEMVL